MGGNGSAPPFGIGFEIEDLDSEALNLGDACDEDGEIPMETSGN